MNIQHGNPLMLEGRRVRDSLRLSGSMPDVLAKLDDIVDLPSIHGGTALKLQNLLDAVAAGQPVPTVASAGMGAKGKAK